MLATPMSALTKIESKSFNIAFEGQRSDLAYLGETVIPLINSLQDILSLVGTAAEFPQVAVVGTQTSGKSSVLEALIGRTFLPKALDFCIRRPLVLQLVQIPLGHYSAVDFEWGEFRHIPGKRFTNFSEIRRVIQDEVESDAALSVPLLEKIINLTIYSPNVSSMTLVDLPGISEISVGCPLSDIEAQVRMLAMSYIKNQSCTILAVSPAADLSNSAALQMARIVDPEGSRTVGIISKFSNSAELDDGLPILRKEIGGTQDPLHGDGLTPAEHFGGQFIQAEPLISTQPQPFSGGSFSRVFSESPPMYRGPWKCGGKVSWPRSRLACDEDDDDSEVEDDKIDGWDKIRKRLEFDETEDGVEEIRYEVDIGDNFMQAYEFQEDPGLRNSERLSRQIDDMVDSTLLKSLSLLSCQYSSTDPPGQVYVQPGFQSKFRECKNDAESEDSSSDTKSSSGNDDTGSQDDENVNEVEESEEDSDNDDSAEDSGEDDNSSGDDEEEDEKGEVNEGSDKEEEEEEEEEEDEKEEEKEESSKPVPEKDATRDLSDSKRIYVGGMPYTIEESDVHDYFAECGVIENIDFMTFPDTGRFRGIAIITFKTMTAAKKALAYNGSDMGGRYLMIKPYKSKTNKIAPQESNRSSFNAPPKKTDGCLTAYIGNLSWDIDEDTVRSFFNDCQVKAVRFVCDKVSGDFKGFGHVDFEDDLSLERAIKKDQQLVLGRPIKVSYAVVRQKPEGSNLPGKGGPKNKGRGCFNCGEDGHKSFDCPKQKNSSSKRQKSS